jgi:hypothetical protein
MIETFVWNLERGYVIAKGDVFRAGDEGYKIIDILQVREHNSVIFVTFQAKKMTDGELEKYSFPLEEDDHYESA